MSKKFWVIFSVVFLVSCGGGGGGGSSEPTPPPTPAASVNLSADPLSVLVGNQTTLTWSTSYASSCSASGSWSGSKPTAGTEDVGIETTGDNQFTLTCSGSGGSGSASVTVEGYENTSGFVVDGYITGAEIFIDQNDNLFADGDEPISNSSDDGSFTIKKVSGNFVSIGGIDFDTQNSLDNLLLWHKNTQEIENRAITPVTSVASFLDQPADINNILGIDQQIDVFAFDPVANKGDGGPNDHLYEKGNQLTVLALSLQGIVNDLNNSNDNSKDIFQVISNELMAEYSETNEVVNIETNAFITKVLDSLIEIKSLSLEGSEAKSVAKALSGVLPMIQVKADDALTVAVFNFSTSTLLVDIKSIANGLASSELVAKYEEDLLSYVAEDQNLDEADLVPEVVANDDLFITEEDTPISFNFLSNDAFVVNSEININLGIPSNGSFEGDNGSITYTPDENYFGSEEVGYTIEQAGFSDSATISITVNPVNDAPEILSSNYAIDENTTDVGDIRATDAENQELTYQIVEGDSSALDLAGKYLSFKEPTNYEEKNIYEFVADVSDGIDSTRKNLRINILDIDEPMVFTSSDSFSINENQTQIGTVDVDDPEGREISYTLSGGDLNELDLNSSTGVLQFKEAPNFEEKSAYTTQVVATDGISEISQLLDIQILDINEKPTFTIETELFFEENSTATLTLAAIDEDQDDLIFSISGADAESFVLNSESGILAFKSPPDFEQKQSYSLSATVTDTELSESIALIVRINNVNESPEFASASTLEMNENSSSVGQIEVNDPEDDELSYALLGGDSSEMNISADGFISLTQDADYEAKDTYITQVRVSDGEFSITQNLKIKVLDLNDPPVFTSSTQYSSEENTTAVGAVTATDEDLDPLSFSWRGPDINLFNVTQLSDGSGVSLEFKNAPNFEVDPQNYELSISASDGDNLVDHIVKISVSDVNEAPYAIETFPAVISIPENGNKKPETIVGTACTDNRYFICSGTINIGNGATQYQFADEDGDTITFSLSGTDASYFIYTQNGSYALKTPGDHEEKAQHQINLLLSDDELTSEVPITVLITDENEAPSVTSTSFNIDENETQVGLVEATDPEGDPLKYSIGTPRIDEGPDGSFFNIDEFTGNLTFKNPPDFETKSSYVLRVYVQDTGGLNSAGQDITVTLNNLDDTAPELTSPLAYQVEENQVDITMLSAFDVEGSDIFFAVDDANFSIGQTTGILKFLNAPDFETRNQYFPTITLSDGVNSNDYQLVINILNVNDNAPVLEGTCNRTIWSIKENRTNLCNPLSGEDADGDPFTFSISGNDLEITESLQFRFKEAPDYESGITQYLADLTVSDGELATIYNMTINVIDADEPVYLTSANEFTVDENLTDVGTITIADPEGDAAVIQGLAQEEDFQYFTIGTGGSSGLLRFKTAGDYEEQQSYTVKVVADDSGVGEQQIFTININLNDVNEAPNFTSSASFSADENQLSIGTIVAADPENNELTYTTNSAGFAINAVSGALTFTSEPDYETKNSYDLTVKVTDGEFEVEQAINVAVNNLNDNPPVFLGTTTFNRDELDGNGSDSVDWFPTLLNLGRENVDGQWSGSVAVAYDADGDDISFVGNDSGVIRIVNEHVGGTDIVAPYSMASNYDYEKNTSITESIVMSDGVFEVEVPITLTLNNINDNSPIITIDCINGYTSPSSSDCYEAENNQDLRVLTYSISDPDGDLNQLELYSGSTIDELINDPENMTLSFPEIQDYEVGDNYIYTRVAATDGKYISWQDSPASRTIYTTNINEYVHVKNFPSSIEAVEARDDGFGIVGATDQDKDNRMKICLKGEDAQYFYFQYGADYDGTRGCVTGSNNFGSEIRWRNSFPQPDFDFESSKKQYNLIIEITDFEGGLGYEEHLRNYDYTINIIGRDDEAPVITSPSEFSVDEGAGQTVATLTATDVDSDNISWSIASQSSNKFSIIPDTGRLIIGDTDYETQTLYSVVVGATDGTNSTNQTITVQINDVNEAPSITSSASFSAEENQIAIGTASATDPEGDSLTYSISGSDIAINSTSGVMTFISAPDYETKNTYAATITVSDGVNSTNQSITVDIINVIEGSAPTNATVFINELHYDMADVDTGEYVEVAGPAGTDLTGWKLEFYNGNNDSLYDQITLSGTLSNGQNGYGFAAFDSAQIQNGDADAIGLIDANNICIELISYEGTMSPASGPCSDYMSNDIGVSQDNSTSPDESLQKTGTGLISSDFSWVSPRAKTKGVRNNFQTFGDPDTVGQTLFGKEVLQGTVIVGTYDRDADYPTWDDTDGDGLSDRHEVLIAQHIDDDSNNPLVYTSSGNSVISGKWYDPYDNVYYYDASDVQVDHVVALYESHISGAGNWTTSEKRTYSNTGNKTSGTLPETSHQFLAVGGSSNSAKGSSDPTDWMPNNTAYHCTYLKKWVEVKHINDLYFGKDEFDYIKAREADCDDSALPTLPSNTDNSAPTATSASYYLNLLPQEQTSGTLTLAGTDSDGDTLTYTITQNPTYGTVSLDGASVTYQTLSSTQNANTETFKFTVNDGRVTSDEATVTIDLRTDPLYKHQWHLNNTGQTNFATLGGTTGEDLNVDSVIVSGITGDGVTVAVVDQGLELAHEDLVDNIITGSYDFVGQDGDPTTTALDGDHGTSVAGLIAAKGWNNKGGRGVSPDASLIGYNYLETGNTATIAQVWGSSPPVSVDVDIYNNSWGRGYPRDGDGVKLDEYNAALSLSESSTTMTVLKNGVENLRDNKGAIYVYSAGNGYRTSSNETCGTTGLACTETTIDSRKNQPYTITVAALDADSIKTSYSSPGASIWVSGFGGEYAWNNEHLNSQGYADQSIPNIKSAMMTTDQTGCSIGYVGANASINFEKNAFDDHDGDHPENPDCNYTSGFNGTSSAAPTVAGVIALMLEANPNLTWRDVKHILAQTSDKTDPDRSYDQQGVNQYSWIENSAGYEHHKWYGFGKIDAAEAVTVAKNFTANSRGTFYTVADTSAPNTLFTDDGATVTDTISITKPSESNNFVEFVKVQVRFDHSLPKTVGIRLLSPDGTLIPILQPYTNMAATTTGYIFDIGVAGLYGESLEGDWTIALNDYGVEDGFVGNFVGWNIYVYGN